MRRILMLLGLSACTVGIPGSEAGVRAPGDRPSFTLTASSHSEVLFRCEFPAPELREDEIAGLRYTHLLYPGLAADGEAGGPGLPATRIRVALPPRGEPELFVDRQVLGSLGGVRFPPLPEPEPVHDYEGRRKEPRWKRGGGEGDAYAKARPRPPVEIESIGWERGVRVATLKIRPVVWDPETGRAEWVSALDVTVRIRGGDAVRQAAGARPRPDRAGAAAFRRGLLNPEDAERFRVAAAAESCAAGLPELWFDDADNWIRVQVQANGIYGVSASNLEAVGVFAAGIDPRTFRLYAGPLVPDVAWASLGWDTLACPGNDVIPAKRHVYERPGFCGGFAESDAFGEIPLWVRGEEDGVFDPGDAVVFYGLGPDNFRDRLGLDPAGEAYFMNPYSAHTVYWLTWDSRLPGPPLRMEVVDAAPLPGAPEVTEGSARLHVERNTFEDPSLYAAGKRWERWFWDFLSSDVGVKRYVVDLPRLAPGSSMDATVRLWGARVPTLELGEASLHHVNVTVNGSSLAEPAVWGGRLAEQAFTPYDAVFENVPAAAQSEFLFRVLPVASNDPNRLDQVHLTWIDVRYRRLLQLEGAAGELEVDAAPAGANLKVTGVPSGTPVLFDVSDPRRPRRLAGAAVSAGTVEAAWTRGEPGVIAVAPGSALPAPHGLTLKPGDGAFQWLRDTAEPLDYVIVSGDPFAVEAEELAEWRRDHLYPYTADTLGGGPRRARVRVVAVTDIMDEFAWGMWDPAAIRYFLEYAYRFYGGPGDDPLAYCLLLGDATNDPRNYGGSGVRDYVPSWEDNRDDIGAIRFGNVQYVSDDPLARFDDPGPDGCPDKITDLYLGRLPVSSRSETRDLIRNKIIRSELSPDYGPWRLKSVLVADDICQSGGRDPLGYSHMRQMEAVDARIPETFGSEKVYLYEYGSDCSINTKPAAKQDLIRTWSDGAWLVNYVGHGGDVVWADEHVLDLADTPLLANAGRYPIVGSFSCSVGKFSNPLRDGLGEAHVKARAGGALVSLAATHLTSSSSNAAFNLVLLDNLFAEGVDRPIPAGVALSETKRTVTIQADKYVCLGDPASPPSVPGSVLEVGGPARLDRGARAAVAVRVPGDASRRGALHLESRDARVVRDLVGLTYRLPGAMLFRGESAVAADTARAEFTVPVSLRGGPDGRIAAYAWGADWDGAGVLDPIEVGGTSVAGDDTTGPLIVLAIDDPSLEAGQEVPVTLEDVSGINLTQLFEFRSILLKIVDRTGLEQFRQDLTREFRYDVGSSTRGSLVFRVPDLEPGAYTITITANDNFNNKGQGAAAVEVGRSSGASEFEGFQAAYPNPFDPDEGSTRLIFSLSRQADVSIRIYTVSGRLVHREDRPGSPAGSNVLVWDGRDQAGDMVSNGVYLAQITASRAGSEESRRILERVVVLRD